MPVSGRVSPTSPQSHFNSGTTFLKDHDDGDGILPRPLPKGICYVANFSSFNDLMDRNILQVDDDEKVHLSTDEVSVIYNAKCEDQNLAPNWKRESRFMELISKNCKGLMFSLKENGLGPITAQCIAQVLAQNSYYALLDLSGNRLRDQGAQFIAELLLTNQSIVHLALKSNDIGHVGGSAIAGALEKNNTLTSLDLSGISGINRNHLGTHGAMALSKALETNNVLCILNLGSNGLGKEGMGLLSRGLVFNKTVTELDLSSNNLGWEGCQILATVFESTNIRQLNIERNYIGDKGSTILAAALKLQRAAGLMESLNLCHNNIRSAGIKTWSESLRLTRALKELYLDGNECGPDGTYEFAMALRENRSLLKLSLNKNEINAESGKHIGEALAFNTTLQELDLGDNVISNLGVLVICASLKKEKSSLQTLVLANNKIGDKGGQEIAAMLKVNTALQNLNIRQNNIKVAGDLIAESLKTNKTILTIDFTYNDFSYKSFASIQQSLERNIKVYRAQAGERLMDQIKELKRDEELLFLTRENIDEEIKLREVAKDKVKQKREALKKTVGSLKQNLQELEDELATKQKARQKEEEANQKLSETIQKFKANMDKQTQALQRKIELENDKIQKLAKQIQTTQKAIKQIVDTEEEVFSPILEQLKEEERLRDTAKEDAKWEAEKLVQWELKLKNLEKQLLAESEAEKKRETDATKSKTAAPRKKSKK